MAEESAPRRRTHKLRPVMFKEEVMVQEELKEEMAIKVMMMVKEVMMKTQYSVMIANPPTDIVEFVVRNSPGIAPSGPARQFNVACSDDVSSWSRVIRSPRPDKFTIVLNVTVVSPKLILSRSCLSLGNHFWTSITMRMV